MPPPKKSNKNGNKKRDSARAANVSSRNPFTDSSADNFEYNDGSKRRKTSGKNKNKSQPRMAETKEPSHQQIVVLGNDASRSNQLVQRKAIVSVCNNTLHFFTRSHFCTSYTYIPGIPQLGAFSRTEVPTGTREKYYFPAGVLRVPRAEIPEQKGFRPFLGWRDREVWREGPRHCVEVSSIVLLHMISPIIVSSLTQQKQAKQRATRNSTPGRATGTAVL